MVTACEDCLTLGAQDDIISQFWSVWLELEKKLYSRCLKYMNGNVTEAEDALSSASIKAFEQVKKFAGQIRNLEAWLMQLTRNLCIDIMDKNSRGPAGVEDIEWVGDNGVLCTASAVATPMMVLEREELLAVIRRAVESLPQGQRDNFVLHYYEGLDHEEIVERLGISYDSVCSQIYKARQRLKTLLRGYFCDDKELDRALEPKRKKSPTPQKRAKKRKIESPRSQEKELATVSTAPDGAVGEGLPEFQDGPGMHRAVVGEKMVESMQTGAQLSTATDCAPVGEEKPDLVSGAGVHLAPVGSSMEEGSALGLAQMSEPTPLFIVDKQNILLDDTTGMVSASVSAGSTCTADDVMGVVQVNVEHECTQFCTWWEAREPVRAPVASGELLLFSPLGGETAIKAPECVQVSDIVGENISDVPGLGSAREPSPPDIVEMRTRPLSEVLSKETVRAASAIAPVVVDRKPDYVSTVDVDHMLSDDGSRVRSPVTPVASGEDLFCSQLPETAKVAPECVPVSDIVGENLKDVPGLGSARSHSPPGRVEKRTRPLGEELDLETVTVNMVSAIAPVVVDRKPSYVSTVVGADVAPRLSDDGSSVRSQGYTSVSTGREWEPVRDIVGKNLKKVCGLGSAREHSPPGIVEKLTRPLGEVLSKETVRAASAIAPVVVDRKPSYVSTVDVDHKLWDDCSSVRSQRYTSVSTGREWVHVRDIVGKNIWKVCGKGSPREHSPPGIVEKRTHPLGEELSSGTETVRAGRAISPVVVDRKLSDVSTVVGVDDAPMLSDDGSSVRSPVTPGASGSHLLCSQQTATVAPEWVPVRDIVGKNIWDVHGNGSARSPSPPGIAEKRTIQFSEELGPQTAAVSAARKTVPVTVEEKRVFFSGAVAFLAKVCEKIKEVCGKGFARSRSHSPPGRVEKLSLQLGKELSKKTETVRAARAIAPVVVDRKPD